MAGNSTERRIGIPRLTHVDLQTGTITGAPHIETVRGIGKNGLPFRAQPRHMSKEELKKAGVRIDTKRQGK